MHYVWRLERILISWDNHMLPCLVNLISNSEIFGLRSSHMHVKMADGRLEVGKGTLLMSLVRKLYVQYVSGIIHLNPCI